MPQMKSMYLAKIQFSILSSWKHLGCKWSPMGREDGNNMSRALNWKYRKTKKIQNGTNYILSNSSCNDSTKIFDCSHGDCSNEIKKHLLLGRKVMTNLDSILKSRDITLPPKVKAMVFPVVMYGYESWTVKKAERRRIDAFELWCWEDSWGSLGLQGDPTSPFWRRSALGFLWKEWC